jgi:cardiolipin synthase A/B
MSISAWSLVVAVLTIWSLTMAVTIVLERRPPTSTIAWLLVLILFPVGGWVMYRLIGPLRLERKKLRRRVSREVIAEAAATLREIEAAAPANHRQQLARVAIAVGEAPPLRADRVTLYTEGDETYAAIAEALEAARHHIHLEYYIWEDDRIGTRLRDLLVTRAKAGVEVRLLLDGTGSFTTRGDFFDPLVEAGACLAWFNPITILGGLRRRRIDFRTHRKIVVCDGRVGFTGGINVAETESKEFSGKHAWRDTHLRIEGSAVLVLQRVFAEDWLYATETVLPGGDAYFPIPESAGSEVVQIVASGPDLDAFAVHKMFFAAITQATHRIWLTTPYFVPDDVILSALVSAAHRGVDVQIIVPRRSDSVLVDLAARSYFPELLAAGTRVFEYRPRFVHSKTFVVDDDVAIVSTANLDNRSFRLNFEVAAVIYGATMNAQLEAAFREDLEYCRELPRKHDPKFWPRLGQAGSRLLSPLL